MEVVSVHRELVPKNMRKKATGDYASSHFASVLYLQQSNESGT